MITSEDFTVLLANLHALREVLQRVLKRFTGKLPGSEADSYKEMVVGARNTLSGMVVGQI